MYQYFSKKKNRLATNFNLRSLRFNIFENPFSFRNERPNSEYLVRNSDAIYKHFRILFK